VRRPTLATALAALAALTVASFAGPASAATATERPERVVVGSLASLTGSAAAYGRSQARGTRLAVAVLNRRRAPGAPRLVLRGADDRSRAAAAKAAFRRFVRGPASAVIGPTLSPVAAVADPIATTAGLPVLAATNTTLDLTGLQTVWRVSLSERAMIPQSVAAVRQRLGVRRAALLVDSADGYSTAAAEAFEAAAARSGIELTARAGYSVAAGDVDGAVAAVRAGDPQALLVAARSDAAVAALKAIRRADGDIPVVGGNGFNADEVIAGAGRAADGAIVAASWNQQVPNPLSKSFVRAYRKRFGAEPDSFAAQGYASVEILAAAVRTARSSAPANVQRALAKRRPTDTVLGRLRFSKDREARYPAAVQIVRDGRFGLLPQPDSIVGEWSGRLSQEGMAPFRVWATIRSLAGGAGNRVRYSGLDCRGTWTPLRRRGSAYRFRENITAGRSDACKGTGTVTLRPTGDPDALRYRFRGGGVTSHGTIRRD
jgi:branched-chain amino acid transport system substrate-binding protein